MKGTRKGSQENTAICSFCEKPEEEVKLIITGSRANICDVCVDVCFDIISEYHEMHFPEKEIEFEEDTRKVCALCGGVTRKDRFIVLANEKSVCTDCIKSVREAV